MKKSKWNVLAVAPLYIFTLVFVVIPIIYMIMLSFMTRAEVWGVVNEFTLDNYQLILSALYLETFLESLKLAGLATFIILLLGYPFGYFMGRMGPLWKKRMMIIIMIPFWTSSLIRLYGWIILFRSNGVMDKFLMTLHITKQPLKLLYSYPAVASGMVYALLPFMILSIYSSVEKLDFSLIEAARDLGANGIKTFFTITLPLTAPGIFSGIILTFIPSMGLFFIADILGGNKVLLVGSLIQEQLTKGRNLPFAAALSVVLMLFTTLMIAIYSRVFHSRELEGVV